MAELKWLEDLLALIEEGSFTHAAQRRHVTQPAFSRRIGLLEDWLGVPIVDRRRKPIGILPAIREREAQVRDLVALFYQLRADVHDEANSPLRVVFVAQHTLAISYFPALLQRVKQALPGMCYRIQTANNEACASLFEKEGDFLLCYGREGEMPAWGEPEVLRMVLPDDRLIPVVGGELASLFQTDADLSPGPLPLLLYPKGGFFADALSGTCLPVVLRDYRVEVICESAFAVSLREMVLAGIGIAWLPAGLVAEDVATGRVLSLADQLGSCVLKVALYFKQDSALDNAAVKAAFPVDYLSAS